VKPAASSELQPERRAGHVAAKATSRVSWSGGVPTRGLGGVWGVARVQGDERNTRGPTRQTYAGPLAVGYDLMTIAIGDTIETYLRKILGDK